MWPRLAAVSHVVKSKGPATLHSLVRPNTNTLQLATTNQLRGMADQSDPQPQTAMVAKSKLYTRTGDQGSSSLFTGERRSKRDHLFEALGSTDELNASLGVVLECSEPPAPLPSMLLEIQSRLLDLGSHVATPRRPEDAQTASPTLQSKWQRTSFSSEHVVALEAWIDQLDSQLPLLTNFILPGGGPCAAHLHVARSICRRAERAMVPLWDAGALDAPAYQYINRLSDWLFVAARYAAQQAQRPDRIYKKSN